MRKTKRGKWNALKLLLIICVLAAAGIGGYAAYGMRMADKLAGMTFEEMIAYTVKDKKDAAITVGIIQGGKTDYKVYGGQGEAVPQAGQMYEIGSITKTFSASLLCKAISEGKASLGHTIDKYLSLPGGASYPTLRSLVTHTSGYKSHYLELPMVSSFLSGENSFHGISGEMLTRRIGKVRLSEPDYPFRYSNFGMAVLGLVLEQIYAADYAELMERYIREDLGLAHTKIAGPGDGLQNGWQWSRSDAYLSAGALLSDIGDMMAYLQLQLLGKPAYLLTAHEALAQVNASSASRRKMGIRVDSAGIGWMIDEKNGIVWHNGATGSYNSYIGFDKERQIGVVVLSNLPPDYRIPATVMGVKILTGLQE